MNQIGISENRLRHILGVARKAYQLALERGHDEIFARKMFMLGWIHDVGYEFSYDQSSHPIISADMLLSLVDNPSDTENVLKISYDAVLNHGYYIKKVTEEWKILNIADFLVDSSGNEVTVSQRLEGVKPHTTKVACFL